MNKTIREQIFEILDGDMNPLFDYEIVCKRLCKIYGVNQWKGFYSRVKYHITKMENEGLLYIHRTTNRGTVFMLKSHSIKTDEMRKFLQEIPF